MMALLDQRKDAVLMQLNAHTIVESLGDFAATRIAAAHQALKKHIQKLLWDPVPHYDDFHRVRIAGRNCAICSNSSRH
ncbi:MAG: hypothetical protein CPDRYMAC_7069 [uncultured Paraburkholderia sp.]|nr:MAG: hypothetical protein CPDRYDRY_7037 [uncultured Paraburkholderia sp.]CAH2945896.1 MAG: hypothetical protein CPDRYMAC_7069 [uncultured Paraburkholderia sp.]